MTSKIVGIDLGTTNSVVAIMEDGRPKAIKDKSINSPIVPSVVGISPTGELIVGEAARNQYIISPEKTVRSIKRKMGQNVKVRMGDKEYTPPQISAMILSYLKRVAEDYLGEKVEKAVITVPAYFSDAQRQATKDAGEIANLEVVRIINEPTASALAYGVDREAEEKNLLVYDLGGGTFDVSVIEKMGEVVEVRATHGNNHLGGDDFDERLQNFVLDKLHEQYPNVDIRKDLKAMARLNRLVENAKIKLSSEPFTNISSEYFAKKGLFSSVHLDMEISRADFVDLIRDLLDSTLSCIDIAMKDSEITSANIDKILLVGGSTRIPAVWELVEKHMGKAPRSDVHPDEAVALGAAVQAAIISGEKVKSVLVDVAPYTLGVEHAVVKGGRLIPGFYKSLIKRNTTIPSSMSEVFFTVYPDQDTVEIKVYQGECGIANMNTWVGSFKFSGISPSKEEGHPREVVIQFDYDVDGILHVSAIDRLASRKEEGLTVTESQIKMSSVEKDRSREVIADLVISGEKKSEHLDKWRKDALAFKQKLTAEKKTDALKELEDILGRIDKGEVDEKLLNNLSDLMYDHDFSPE